MVRCDGCQCQWCTVGHRASKAEPKTAGGAGAATLCFLAGVSGRQAFVGLSSALQKQREQREQPRRDGVMACVCGMEKTTTTTTTTLVRGTKDTINLANPLPESLCPRRTNL